MENKNSNIFIIALVIILFFGGIAGAYYIGKLRAENNSYEALIKGDTVQNGEGEAPAQPEQQDPNELAANVAPIAEDAHYRGDMDVNIALIEYSDYECPFCATFHDTAMQVAEEYGDQISWVYRHFPLDGIHPFARPAAIASECVAELGGNDAFWVYTDAIFANQEQLSKEYIDETALDTGIDQTAYTSCLESDETAEKVQADFENGQESGIRGTPGVIVLNRDTEEVTILPGAVPLQQVKSAIDSLMK